MNTLHTFQNTIFRWILLTGLPILGCAWCVSATFAQGFLLGLGAGCLGLMLKLRLARRLVRRQSVRMVPGGFVSMVATMAALYGGYRVDTEYLAGMIGASSGALLVPLLLVALGITNWDLRDMPVKSAGMTD